MKEELDHEGEPLLKKQIMPALHRLQEAFLVFEDQLETDWERPWNDFASEWPDLDLDRISWEYAAAEVVRRFFEAMVFATFEQVKDRTGWSGNKVKKLLSAMEEDGNLIPVSDSELGDGWVQAFPTSDDTIDASCFMIHKADFLSYAHLSELKTRYKDLEVLQYLLIDGDFKGAVLGHWRIGPHDVDDVVVELPKKERVARKAEVRKVYSGDSHEVICYDGKELG